MKFIDNLLKQRKSIRDKDTNINLYRITDMRLNDEELDKVSGGNTSKTFYYCSNECGNKSTDYGAKCICGGYFLYEY